MPAPAPAAPRAPGPGGALRRPGTNRAAAATILTHMRASTASGQLADRLTDNVARVLLGKKNAIQLATVALLAEGHLLIEDNPGVGKTLLARALATSLDLPFQRVQCTADLL